MKTIGEIYHYFGIEKDYEALIEAVEDDSRRVKGGSLFIAIEKGNDYIEDAKRRGASLILSDRKIPSLKERLLSFLLWFYDHPEKYLTLIGVTGTNGKTSTAFFIHQLLKNSFLVTTVKKEKKAFLSKNTTPYPVELVHLLMKAKELKCRYFIMEISSIGICEKRLEGLLFQTLILTGITSDHLDYHRTLFEYQSSKIDYLNAQVGKKFIAADPSILKRIHRPYIYVESLKEDKRGYLVYEENHHRIPIKRIPSYNATNLSLAIAVAKYYGVKGRSLKYRLKSLRLPLGRHQVIMKKPLVIIDYAHSESAFKTILVAVRKITRGRLFLIFGAGGERDVIKRSGYGDLAYLYADYAMITNDNPRHEDPLKIAHDIAINHQSFFHIELDRHKAIIRVLNIAQKNDTVLIVGKGHEVIQNINGQEFYFNDEEEVRKWRKTTR